MSGNHTNIQGPCDFDPKIKWGHLLIMTNQYVKYEDLVMHSNQDNKLKTYYHSNI
jgi:hypothetical protein